MKRVPIIAAAAGALLVTAVLCAYGFVFHTAPGRAALAGLVERELGAALNSEAEIGALEGALPRRIVIRDAVLKSDGEPWLEVERLTLAWRPFALLRGRIDITEASLERARLSALPPESETAEDEEAEPLSIRLPRNLPAVRIEQIQIVDLVANLDGARRRLQGAGALAMGGGEIDADLALASEDGLDAAAVVLTLAPEENRLGLSARLEALPGGLIAALAGLDAPLLVTAQSDSPLEAADIDLAGAFGETGRVEARVTANLQNLTAADASVSFTPGAALGARPEFAVPVTADIRAEERPDEGRNGGGAVLIRSLTGAVGEAQGEIVWRNRGRFVDGLTATISATPSRTYIDQQAGAALAAYLGGPIRARAALNRNGDGYDTEGTIEGEAARLALADGRTDLDTTFSGRVSARLSPMENAPPGLSPGLEGSGLVSLDADRRVTVRGLALETGDGSSLGADLVYSLADDVLALEGDLAAEPALIAALSPGIAADGPLSAAFSLNGALDRLTLNADLDVPAARMNGEKTPAFALEADLAGLPRLPTGDIAAAAKGGAQGRFDAQIRSSVDGRIAAPSIAYRGAGFSLAGSGAVDPAAARLDISLNYNGEAGASPLPGLRLAGGLRVEGVASRDGALNNLDVSAPRLMVNDIDLTGLSVSAEGPPGATRVKVALADLKSGEAAIIEALTADARLDLGSPLAVSLAAFDAVVMNNRATLTAPAEFRFADGVEIEGLRLSYGERGAIALDGALSSARWRAALEAENVNIPQADGRITLSLDLDTDRDRPASGRFALRSLLIEEGAAGLSGDMVWTGEQLILSNEARADALDMRMALPARLVRTPDLGLETDGPLDGYARYNGALETIAAYLPPALQTLEGDFSLDMTLSGSAAAPLVDGRAQIRDGQYTELQSGFALAGLRLDADASYAQDGSVIAVSGGARGAGQTGSDTITLSGELTLGEDSALRLETVMTGAVLSARPVDMVRADGRIVLSGPLDALSAEGDITIDELDAEIITPENTGLVDIKVVPLDEAQRAPLGGEGGEAGAAAPAPGLDYRIGVVADDRIFVRGRGLESEWSADIAAANDGADPVLTGAMTLRRGYLDFSGRRFNLTRGVITFDRLSTNNPLLDIRAEYQTGDGVTAAIVVSGRGDNPSIALQSTPELPSEDVMALVLFGKPAQELGPVETLQIAEALASLSGVGPFGGEGVTGRLRQTLGLDLLNIDPDLENGGGALTVGKYVADGVFVSATQDAQGRNGSVRVEYEVTDNITVETELSQDGDQTVSANWKRDF